MRSEDFRSDTKKLWNFRTKELSFPGTKVPWVELSFPGTFVPKSEIYMELSFPNSKIIILY